MRQRTTDRAALSHASAGAALVPRRQMDGRVGRIREALTVRGIRRRPHAYAAKYC